MPRRKITFSKKKMEEAIKGSAGNIALISRKLGCCRDVTIRNIQRHHLEKAVEDDFNNLVDTLEARAWQIAQEGDSRMIIKMLESLKRERYGDQQQVEIKHDKPPVIQFQGFPSGAIWQSNQS